MTKSHDTWSMRFLKLNILLPNVGKSTPKDCFMCSDQVYIKGTAAMKAHIPIWGKCYKPSQDASTPAVRKHLLSRILAGKCILHLFFLFFERCRFLLRNDLFLSVFSLPEGPCKAEVRCTNFSRFIICSLRFHLLTAPLCTLNNLAGAVLSAVYLVVPCPLYCSL